MTVTVIIRSYNSATTLARCLQSVAEQSVACRVVLVDSGSTDETINVASTFPNVEVVQIPHAEFTYGRALNIGIQAADSTIVMALSSHCWLPTRNHVERLLPHFADGRVAAIAGIAADANGRQITEPVRATEWPVWPLIWWGFTNHANAIRRSVWERVPFDEGLPACEDKAWAGEVHALGYSIIYDPSLRVSSDHRRQQGIQRLYRRGYQEGWALQALVLPTVISSWHLFQHRYLKMQGPSKLPTFVRWINPFRIVEVSGIALGARARRLNRRR